jgi:hypothetical protein
LPSNDYLCWFHRSGFQQTCRHIRVQLGIQIKEDEELLRMSLVPIYQYVKKLILLWAIRRLPGAEKSDKTGTR